MNKVNSNNKGVMNNETYERITTILWIVATKILSNEVKDIKKELILHRK